MLNSDVAMDLRKIVEFRNVARAANQGSKKAIKLLHVHCLLAAKACWSAFVRLLKSESFKALGVIFWRLQHSSVNDTLWPLWPQNDATSA